LHGGVRLEALEEELDTFEKINENLLVGFGIFGRLRQTSL
jgi:hypothetical protein